MAAKNHSVGIDHVTVVPEPATPSDADEARAGETDDEARAGETDDECED